MLENNASFEKGEKSLQYANKTIKSTNVNSLYKESEETVPNVPPITFKNMEKSEYGEE